MDGGPFAILAYARLHSVNEICGNYFRIRLKASFSTAGAAEILEFILQPFAMLYPHLKALRSHLIDWLVCCRKEK